MQKKNGLRKSIEAEKLAEKQTSKYLNLVFYFKSKTMTKSPNKKQFLKTFSNNILNSFS